MKRIAVTFGVLLAGAWVGGQVLPDDRAAGSPPAESASRAASKPASRPGQLERPHMVIHLAPRQMVVIDAEVCSRERIVEFVLVTKGQREYESILRTQARAQDLHLAMLAFGLTPGKPAGWVWDEENGRAIPPRGPKLRVEVAWTDPKTRQPRRADVGDWLANAAKTPARLAVPKEWIFIGSEVLPSGKYRADEEGVFIAVANDPAAVIDVPFPSSKEQSQQELVVKEDAVPPPGTPVQVIITPAPGGRDCPYARTLVEIDRNGDAYIHNKRMTAPALRAWAEQYIERHSKGSVVMRSDAQAKVCDIDRTRDELKIGGVSDFDEQHLLPDGIVLPRTAAQSAEQLAKWASMFANPGDEIDDPGKQAVQALAQVQSELERLADQRTLLDHYQKLLRQQAEAYEARRKAQADTEAARKPVPASGPGQGGESAPDGDK